MINAIIQLLYWNCGGEDDGRDGDGGSGFEWVSKCTNDDNTFFSLAPFFPHLNVHSKKWQKETIRSLSLSLSRALAPWMLPEIRVRVVHSIT